jgi:hypothetical protein
MKNLCILLAIGLAIFLIIQFPHATINPGELAEAHQKLNNECLSCHKPFGGIANEKCISCHKLADIGNDKVGKQNKPLFHHQLSNQECSSCHSEHQGLIPEHALSGFKHELLSASIINNCISCHYKPTDNLHTQVSTNCNSCHQTQSWKGSTAFNHEVILNKSNCASCHQKPKDNFHNIIKDNCDKCHSTSKWVPSTFAHSAYFILDQNHNTTCNTCHSNNNYSSFTCYGCHEHSQSKIIAEHNEEGIYNISNCTSCHKSGNEHDIKNNNKSLNEKERNKIKDFITSNDKKENDDD